MYSRNLSVETDGCIIHACASKIICEVAVGEKSTVAEGLFQGSVLLHRIISLHSGQSKANCCPGGSKYTVLCNCNCAGGVLCN